MSGIRLADFIIPSKCNSGSRHDAKKLNLLLA